MAGAGEAVGDGAPGRVRRRGFDYDERGAGFVAFVEFGVEGAGEGRGVAGEHGYPGEFAGQRDLAAGDDAGFLGGKLQGLELRGKAGLVAP